MKKQFKLLFMVMILGASFVSNGWAGSKKSADKIRIGVEGAYPPFSEVDKDGKMKGFDIDISKALCKDLCKALCRTLCKALGKSLCKVLCKEALCKARAYQIGNAGNLFPGGPAAPAIFPLGGLQ